MMRDGMRYGWALLLVVALALVGCGDSNLFEGQSDSSGNQAQLEEGLDALDSGDWAEAQRIFSEMDQNDPEIRKYLASAYVGEAGFDVLELVEQIDAAQDAAGDDDVIYDIVTGLFDEGGGTLSNAQLSAKVDLMVGALTALGAITPPAARAADDVPAFGDVLPENEFQAAIYAALYAVLSVVEQLEDPNNPGQLLLTLDAWDALTEPQACGVVAGVQLPAVLNDLLGIVRSGISAIEPDYMGGEFDNDIAMELDTFLTELGYLPDEDLTVDELRAYLRSILAITCP